MQGEVDEIGDQKDAREDERCKHGRTVLRNSACADKAITEEQRNGRAAIEDCIDQRQRTKLRAGDISGSVEVDEPADEGACQCTYCNDGCDDRRGRAEIGRRNGRWNSRH